MIQGVPGNKYRPVEGLRLLTWPQLEKMQARYGALRTFLAENDEAEARLIMVVKRGHPRFAELETSANGHLPAEGKKALPWETVKDIDAKLCSLCAFTSETGGEARLVLVITWLGEIQMKMILSEELSPTR
jgi:hypothetical protein